MDEATLLRQALALIEEKKGGEPVVIDLRDVSVPTSYFVITHGDTSAQVKAIVSSLLEKMPTKVSSSEGLPERRWAVLDYGDVVVHVFLKDAREFYDIESLWSDRIVADPGAV